jgi:hypothetical protein
MQSRYIATAIVAIAVVFTGFILWRNMEKSGLQEFSSVNMGLAFTYPGNYVLSEYRDFRDERDWRVILLTDESNLPLPENSEGPPSIGIIIFDNIENYTLEEWVRSSSFSNFELSGDKQLATTTIDGKPALAYRYSGLYENDAVVALAGDRIYFFTVAWITQQDTIRQDFRTIVQSVELLH